MQMIQDALHTILERQLPDGGFSNIAEGPFDPEATAWAAIACHASRRHPDPARRACDKLVQEQQSDGRVIAAGGCAGAYWPTSLSALAWNSIKGYEHHRAVALAFLLSAKGRHKARTPGTPAGHDTSIVGWSWVEQTHSWIEPTCLAMLALKSGGYLNHPRTTEATRMIMDRQLPAGGWNYGNTTVFEETLLPTPENTGQAICALEGLVHKKAVKDSLAYLEQCIRTIRTPMTLSWGLMGLASWASLPPRWKDMVIESLELQDRYGGYTTAPLAQLMSVYFGNGRVTEIMV